MGELPSRQLEIYFTHAQRVGMSELPSRQLEIGPEENNHNLWLLTAEKAEAK